MSDLEKQYAEQSDYWRQRSQIECMKDGDKNTRFFHAKATTRARVNHISGLENRQGQWVESKTDVENVVADYFETLFSTTEPSERDIDGVLHHINPRMTEEANQILVAPFSSSEVTEALSSMSPRA